MSNRNTGFAAIVLCLIFILPFTLAYGQTASDQEKVDRLGQEIRNYQTNEVWSGGNEYSGAYTWNDRSNFLNNEGGVAAIVRQARENQAVVEGAKILANFDRSARFAYYRQWSIPVYSTWAMIGEISSRGTTDAGYQTEREISEALVGVVKEKVLVALNQKQNQSSSVNYQADFERLSKMIRKHQTDVVWSGGNQYSGCYMDIHRENFLNQGGAGRVVRNAQRNAEFVRIAKELRMTDEASREKYYNKWSEPVYPTWGMIGEISSRGTTNAGYQTEKDIADGLVELVREIVANPDNY
jgi:hypothetical protein